MVQLSIHTNDGRQYCDFWRNFVKIMKYEYTSDNRIIRWENMVDALLKEYSTSMRVVDGRTVIQFEDEQFMSIFLLKFA